MRTSLFALCIVACTPACVAPQHAVPAAAPALEVTSRAETPAPAPVPVERTLAEDEVVTTSSAATFTAPTGWKLSDAAGVTTVRGPEGDLVVRYLELEAGTGQQAIEASWKRVEPKFALAVAGVEEVAARDGWDAATQMGFDTPAAAARTVFGFGVRKGALWRVFLCDGSNAGLSRRGAQVGAMLESLRAPGVKRESWTGKTAHLLDAARLAELDTFVETAMKAEDVPGAAIAIVQGGRIVHERGYGVRELGGKQAVGPHTLFLTGSTGKSLVTLMMARAVDAKTFGWDTPVTYLLPTFALGDEATTRALQMRHTVCACTGMPRQDLEMLFESRGITPEARLAAMRTMAPTTRFGETFQYSNLLVAAGGYVAGHALFPKLPLGQAFDRAMQEQVFGPLGMKDATYDFARARKADHASPHSRGLDGARSAFQLDDESWVSAVRPAGGQWASAHDFARVLLLELGRGELDGKRVVSEANPLERRKPQIAISNEFSYGMGLMTGTRNGVRYVTHDGGTLGFSTTYFWLPDQGLGAVVVSNVGDGATFVDAVAQRLLEQVFDGEPHAMENLELGARARAREVARGRERLDSEEPAWVAPLLGKWTNPGLGVIELGRERGALFLDAGEWRVGARTRTDSDGAHVIVTATPPFAGLDFFPGERDGNPVLVTRSGQGEYVFTRVTK